MEERPFYASDDRSSIELIEQDFAVSRKRSLKMREHKEAMLTVDNITKAVAVMAFVLFILGLLLVVSPE